MTTYKVQNKALPNGVPKIPCDMRQEACRIVNDTFAASRVTPWIEGDKSSTIDNSRCIRIIKARSPYLGRSLNPTLVYKEPSLASDEEDFWSFDTLDEFLGIAERRGAAVCQLLKQCSDSELDDFVTSLQCNPSYSVEQLKILLDSTKVQPGSRGSKPVTLWQSFDQTNSADLDRLKDELRGVYIPFGTGFLVGKNYLLTNHHVLPSPEEAEKFIARFRYDRNSEDDKTRPVDYYLDSSGFASSPEEELDYTLVKLCPLGEKETQHLTGKDKNNAIAKIRKDHGLQFLEAGENFGWLPLFEDDALISPPLSIEQANEFQDQLERDLDADLLEKARKFGLPGEPVNIIQHPRGRSKEIVFYSNRVQKLTPRYLHYQADTDLGSSGSPVLNSQWQVVALHHAVLVEVDQDEQKAIKTTVQGSIGIRISEIVKDLKSPEKQLNEFVKRFVTDPMCVIDLGSKPNRGTIYILAGVRREEIYRIKDPKFNEPETMLKLRDRIESAEINQIGEKVCTLQDYGYSVKMIPNQLPENYVLNKNLTYKENVIRAWVEQRKEAKDLVPGDIAIELTMDAYTQKQQITLKFWGLNIELSIGTSICENKSLRGVGIYYAGTRDERKHQAELFLKTLLNQKRSPKVKKTIESLLPNRGVRSDQTILEISVDENGSRPKEHLPGLPFCRNIGIPSFVLRHGSCPKEHLSGLPFCRNIGIPSFVLRLGFVTNSTDRREVSEHLDVIAQGIAKGLLTWGNSINAIPVETYQTQNNSSEKSSKQYFLSF